MMISYNILLRRCIAELSIATKPECVGFYWRVKLDEASELISKSKHSLSEKQSDATKAVKEAYLASDYVKDVIDEGLSLAMDETGKVVEDEDGEVFDSKMYVDAENEFHGKLKEAEKSVEELYYDDHNVIFMLTDEEEN